MPHIESLAQSPHCEYSDITGQNCIEIGRDAIQINHFVLPVSDVPLIKL
jgi:hypothetical protein